MMKIFNILGSLALLMALTTACAVNDPFADNMEIGQVVPTVSWELSDVAKAGGFVNFKAKYYTSSDHNIDHCEVWGLVTRTTAAAATCRLTTSLSYTKTVNSTDTIRNSVKLASFEHSKAEWDGHEYVLVDSFQVSSTLAPITWVEPEIFDEDRFNMYYPETFQQEFVDHVVEYLTRDSVYYNDLRNIYINYDFTAEQFEALNNKYGFSIPFSTESGDKSNMWYVNTNVVDHYYYVTIDDAGVKTEHEIATPEQAPAGVNIYEVYESSPWVYSRYSDDTGGRITSVRKQYMPFWKDLINEIPFKDWIYNSSDKNYSVNFTRNYILYPTFRVFDETGKMGKDTEIKQISLN
ncbi:MAG: hypothetical protein IKW83_00350 [Muribaculaceae bacterium]|nr:hypothetical protein [Muribaculaceae bacterium]